LTKAEKGVVCTDSFMTIAWPVVSAAPAWSSDSSEGALGCAGGREGGELEQFAVELEPGADHVFAAEADVVAEPDRRLLRRACRGQRVEERGDRVGCRGLAVEGFERVEQIAAAQLRPQLDEGVRAGDPVEAECVAEREQRAALSRLEREARLELVEA